MMNCSSRNFALFVLGLALVAAPLRAMDDTNKTPDALVLKDGRTVRGLIIRNSRDAVLLQEKTGEVSYPKSAIVRILDEANTGTENTKINRRGRLPSWQTIANDLRSHDEIRSVREIPPTLIDQGEFANVPYMSFRVNGDIELDIYGDPRDPAGVEMGIYGSRSGDRALRNLLRSYLAGYLTSREEIAAIYAIPFTGGIRQAGDVTIEITPKTAPDAYGAWWISLYNKNLLAAARVSPKKYATLVRPENEVVDKNGRVIWNDWGRGRMSWSQRVDAMGRSAQVVIQGFFRDKDGNFQLFPVSSNGE
jgi:hypothetical protein